MAGRTQKSAVRHIVVECQRSRLAEKSAKKTMQRIALGTIPPHHGRPHRHRGVRPRSDGDRRGHGRRPPTDRSHIQVYRMDSCRARFSLCHVPQWPPEEGFIPRHSPPPSRLRLRRLPYSCGFSLTPLTRLAGPSARKRRRDRSWSRSGSRVQRRTPSARIPRPSDGRPPAQRDHLKRRAACAVRATRRRTSAAWWKHLDEQVRGRRSGRCRSP